MRIEGDLAKRTLLSALPVTPQPATDTVLSNSVVLVGVDPRGEVRSAVLRDRSGSKDADAAALKLAGEMRFEPERSDVDGTTAAREMKLTRGAVAFRWLTVAAPSPNSVVGP